MQPRMLRRIQHLPDRLHIPQGNRMKGVTRHSSNASPIGRSQSRLVTSIKHEAGTQRVRCRDERDGTSIWQLRGFLQGHNQVLKLAVVGIRRGFNAHVYRVFRRTAKRLPCFRDSKNIFGQAGRIVGWRWFTRDIGTGEVNLHHHFQIVVIFIRLPPALLGVVLDFHEMRVAGRNFEGGARDGHNEGLRGAPLELPRLREVDQHLRIVGEGDRAVA